MQRDELNLHYRLQLHWDCHQDDALRFGARHPDQLYILPADDIEQQQAIDIALGRGDVTLES